MPSFIVLVPTFERSELLWLCLERLLTCPELNKDQVHVFIDRNSLDSGTYATCQHFKVPYAVQPQHHHYGNSYNVLKAYQYGYENAEFSFLVEDDVMVCPDFFDWHFKVQALGNYFCSIAQPNPWVKLEVSPSYFASIGTCFKREKLALVLSHSEAFLENPTSYLDKTFNQIAPSQLSYGYEQDGLTQRVLLSQSLPTVAPVTPKCYHMGWYGYHREGIRPSGNLPQRVQYLRKAVHNAKLLAQVQRDNFDIKPFPI